MTRDDAIAAVEAARLAQSGAQPDEIAAALRFEAARAATWEGAVEIGVRQRDIEAAYEDLRASRAWD